MIEVKTESGKVVATVTAANPNIHGCEEGIWIEVKANDNSKPTICLIKDKVDGTYQGDWYIGAYRNAADAPLGCDLALRFSKDGPVLQVIRGKEVKIIDLFDIFEQSNAKNIKPSDSDVASVDIPPKPLNQPTPPYPQVKPQT